MKTIQKVLVVISLLMFPVLLQAQGLDTAKIDQVLGRSGTKMGEVYKVGFPRTDLQVTRHGVLIKPGLALGSWAAFQGTDDNAMVMGDLVLLQDEVNPVMMKLRESGFEILAVHNHLLDETPHVMYMHYMAKGNAAELAAALKSALDTTKTPPGKPATAAKPTSEPAFVKAVEEILGHKGSFNGGVLSFGIPRADPITDRGMTIPPAMGMGEAINFQEAGNGKVATTGDFVLVADEVNPVISALEEHHIEVEALHNHMLYEEPRLFFMHFWGEGSVQAVAEGIKAALDKVHTKQ